MKSFWLTLLLILFVGSYFNLAFSHSFNEVLTEDGEDNLSVRQIIQDKQGFLWLATFRGVYLYKGYDYISNFDKNNEIDSDVTALQKDENGNIWIGTNNGLAKYNLQTEEITNYNSIEADSLSTTDQKIRCLDIDSKGQLWIGTREGGLNLYNPKNKTFKSFKIKVSVKDVEYVKCILVAKNGSIWLGTWQNGVYCLTVSSNNEIEAITNYRVEDEKKSLSHNHVYCLFEDTDGAIIAGTRNGLNHINPITEEVIQYHISDTVSEGRLSNYIRSIHKNKNGKIWIGTWGGIIICDQFSDLENENIELLYHDSKYPHSISNNQIMNIFQDNSGSVWIGTENGLNNYNPYQNQFQHISVGVIKNLQEQTATDFYPYKDGVLILTLSHGIIFKNDKTNHFFPTDNQFSKYGEKLYSLLIDSKDNVWAGTYNGTLIKYNTKSGLFTTHKHPGISSSIYALAESPDGNILIAYRGVGLKCFIPSKNQFGKYKGLPDGVEINDILIDNNKNTWLVSEFGIYKQNAKNEQFEQYLPEIDKTTPNVFTSIIQSNDGTIFIGGRNGFYKYNNKLNSFTEVDFGQKDPLWVTNIQVDSKNNLWLNLNFNKIARVNADLSEIKFFSVNNGIRSSQYNRRGFYIDDTDNLYISGFDDIYQFNTSSPVVNQYSPVPVFTSLRLNNTEIHAGTEINNQVILEKSINHQKEIILNHRNKDFTLDFISTSFLNKDANQYKYILHGYDKDWHIGTRSTAHYTNLSAGKYTFEVYSANNDGIWSENSASIAIRVKPYPMLSKWAIFIYVVILGLLYYQIRKVLIIRLRLKNDLLIERVKREKEEKFNQERLRFYTNISHELRTPLTLIMGPIKQLIDPNNKSDHERSRLQHLILNNSNKLLNLVNQILDFRKSLYEGMKLKVTHTDIVSIIEANLEAFDYMSKEKSIETIFSDHKKEIYGWFDREKLDIILFNLLSNAYKYTHEFGVVTVAINELPTSKLDNEDYIEINITNTGKGIEKELHEKIFERFYQIDDHAEATGTGIGLSLMKNLVELHHGSVHVDSKIDESTTFSVRLPLMKKTYTPEEIFDIENVANKQMRQVINYSENKTAVISNVENKEGKPKVVIIEDNYELRAYLSDFLSDEYNVFTANDGVEGLSLCMEKDPHLIISDIMMDNMDGLEFCKQIKSNPTVSHIPVILMTALASSDNKIEGYKTGADDYITKPFDPQLLKVRIQNLLRKIEHTKSDFKVDLRATPKELTISKLDEDLITKTTDLIELNLDNSNYNKEKLCADLGVSYSYLYRKIKNIAGTSPSDFIQTFRLKKAAQMLVETDNNISEVAFKVGYNDALYFSKCFKKQFGASPSKFKANQRVATNEN